MNEAKKVAEALRGRVPLLPLRAPFPEWKCPVCSGYTNIEIEKPPCLVKCLCGRKYELYDPEKEDD